MKVTKDAACAMLVRLPPYCITEWCRYKGQVVVAWVNLEATMKAGKPMLNLSHCMTQAFNECVLQTVQYDKNKFAPYPPL